MLRSPRVKRLRRINSAISRQVARGVTWLAARLRLPQSLRSYLTALAAEWWALLGGAGVTVVSFWRGFGVLDVLPIVWFLLGTILASYLAWRKTFDDRPPMDVLVSVGSPFYGDDHANDVRYIFCPIDVTNRGDRRLILDLVLELEIRQKYRRFRCPTRRSQPATVSPSPGHSSRTRKTRAASPSFGTFLIAPGSYLTRGCRECGPGRAVGCTS